MKEIIIEQMMQTAIEHHQARRLAEAEKTYREILAIQPDHAHALLLLGTIAVQVGHLDAGIELIRRAIAVNPDVAAYHIDLGNALRTKGEIDGAITAFQEAARIEPGNALAHSNLGVVLAMRGRTDEAAAAFREAIRLKPDYFEAHNNLGNALREKREWDGAIEACRRALQIKPEFLEAHINLGSSLRGKGELDAAIAAYRRAISLNPAFAETHNNLGNALKERGSLQGAVAEYREAIRLKPNLAVGHYNLGCGLLLLGDFERGWAEYEWRLIRHSWEVQAFSGRRWSGEDLGGKTLLLWGEQGFGDVIQFARYATMAARRGGRIVTWCQRELIGLLKSNPDLGKLVPADGGVPTHDYHCPLMSLAGVFNTRLETIPAPASYLNADPALIDSWRKKLGNSDRRLRVGLAWAGNPRFLEDRPRSLTLDRLEPLGAARDVRFYGLQKGSAGEQAKNPPKGLEFQDIGPDLSDFADTAAVMSLMDLIITTDTSAAHLAGALGRPVWVMLQFVPDWRWLLEREDNPWYPSMRLFRQKSPGEWGGVISRVAQSLGEFRSPNSARSL